MNKKQHIVVIGRQGQIARELADLDWPAQYPPSFLGRREIDIFSPATALATIAEQKPVAIVNAAAYAGVDRAEQEPNACWRLNTLLPARLAGFAQKLDVPLLHLSTDYVFGGLDRVPQPEDAPTAPRSSYGLSKLAGEEAIVARGGRALIVRSAWLFGRHGHNFLKTILAKAASGETLRVVDDQIGSPTPAANLAGILRDLALDLVAGRELPTLLHVAGGPKASWHQFAAAILENFRASGRLNSMPELVAVPTVANPRPAPRPLYSALDCGRAESLGIALPDWQAALKDLAADWPVERQAA